MNQFERIDYPIKQLTSGDTLNVSLFRITSSNPGPHVHIQASVHGAEIQGNAVIYQLMKYFAEVDFNGSITFIPMANPMAINHKAGTHTHGRFNPVNGNNWNRNYVDLIKLKYEQSNFSLTEFVEKHRDSEWAEIKKEFKKALFEICNNHKEYLSTYGLTENKRLNLFLQKVASTADIVLDLHTGPVAARYLYVPDYAQESAQEFHFPHSLIIPPVFAGAMDEATFCPWVELQKAFSDIDRIIPLEFESFTVELGSEDCINLSDAEIDMDRILSYLKYKKVVKNFSKLGKGNEVRCKLEDYKTYHAPIGGLVEYLKFPGERVSKGTPLCRILNFRKINDVSDLENAVTEVLAREDCIVINHCPSGAVAEGHDLFQVMTNYEEV